MKKRAIRIIIISTCILAVVIAYIFKKGVSKSSQRNFIMSKEQTEIVNTNLFPKKELPNGSPEKAVQSKEIKKTDKSEDQIKLDSEMEAFIGELGIDERLDR